jgi:hypothetical protein
MANLDPDRPPQPPGDGDLAWLQKELEEAHRTIRSLLRQLSKEQTRHAETARAYNLTVANLVEATRQTAQLEHERDMWKARADGQAAPFTAGTLTLTPAEISAIRKAMARLHHPDTGGDVERMKLWNATLDPLEH